MFLSLTLAILKVLKKQQCLSSLIGVAIINFLENQPTFE